MIPKAFLRLLLLLLPFAFCAPAFSQSDSIHLDYPKIFSSALDGNISAVLQLTDVDSSRLSLRDRKTKKAFDARFRFANDESRFPEKNSAADGLIAVYKNYWRKALLDNAGNYDTLLLRELTLFLSENYAPAKALNTASNEDTVNTYLLQYIHSLHLYSTGLGKTGRLVDLLIWQTQKDTVYRFAVSDETITAPVTFMDDFISLGWEQYATLGKLYPGGWTTQTSLFCVKSAYDLSSESFLISYLAHEGRHFKDYILFPKLESPDLEYRAKLTELSMAQTTLYSLIQFFITNANHESENGHSLANYCVIRDLSQELFHKDFENDIEKWKQLSPKKINKAAQKVLQQNTKLLKKQGKDVSRLIK